MLNAATFLFQFETDKIFFFNNPPAVILNVFAMFLYFAP